MTYLRNKEKVRVAEAWEQVSGEVKKGVGAASYGALETNPSTLVPYFGSDWSYWGEPFSDMI